MPTHSNFVQNTTFLFLLLVASEEKNALSQIENQPYFYISIKMKIFSLFFDHPIQPCHVLGCLILFYENNCIFFFFLKPILISHQQKIK